MTVQLEVGMTGIRRDGARVGPVVNSTSNKYKFELSGRQYTKEGRWFTGVYDGKLDIIAAGFPWADLGAKLGDTVRLMWSGIAKQAVGDMEYQVHVLDAPHPDSLYVIVKRAEMPKPADRPRAAHKLDLQECDVVELVGWQGEAMNPKWYSAAKFTVAGEFLISPRNSVFDRIESSNPKGHRPLFRVISRAADVKQDEVIVLTGSSCGGDDWVLGTEPLDCDTDRLTITFPHGSDVGTVTREKL